MDNQSNPPTDPPSDQFQNLPVRTYRISSLSRKKRKKLRIQLNTELQRVKAMIRTTNIKAAMMKKAKIKAAEIKTDEAGSHQVQNVLPQNLAKLIDRCNDGILKRLRKYPNCKHLNEPVFVEGLGPEETIGLNKIADRFKRNFYKSPFQFADDMTSACNHAINYDGRDEVVKVASQVLDKVDELIEPILADWKRLGGGGVDDEEILKESTDVEAGLGEKSGDIGENGVSDSEGGDDAGYIDFNDSDSDNNEDDSWTGLN